tara:strand:- start:377 stop:616 length:240 start_codon:yes stop_codon:yes gene_type:complete
MFDLIFTAIVNIVGDFFQKEFLTIRYAIQFLLILNAMIGMIVIFTSFSLIENLLLVVAPNTLFIIICLIVNIIIYFKNR